MAALALLAQAGCGILWQNYDWCQKITLTVETPDGIVTGVGMQRVAVTNTDGAWVPPEARGASSDVTGEAAVVEVAPGRYLFALLTGPDRGNGHRGDAGQIAQYAFGPALQDDRGRFLPIEPRMERLIELIDEGASAPLPPEAYPLLVTFVDPDDPASVRAVDPNDLAAAFGPGHALRGITVTLSRDQIETGQVEEVLRWLSWSSERLLAAGNGRNPVQIPNTHGRTTAIGRTSFRSK